MQIRGIAVFLFFLLLGASTTGAQSLDLVISGGRVIDPRNGIDAVMDVGITDGRVAEIAATISPARAVTVIDATGFVVTPGLVDLHTHVFYGTTPDSYLSDGYSAVQTDAFSFRSGVTTVVDLGGSGWRNFIQFKEQVVDRSQTRVLAFLNIVGNGMKGGPIEQNLADMDSKLTAMRATQFPEIVVGVKVAHYFGEEWDPVDRAVEAGRLASVPVAVDFGGHEPPLSLQSLLLEHLRPGDFLTHAYAKVDGRISLVDAAGRLRPFVFEARERGVLFDVGHGGGSFRFDQAVPSMRQGFPPDTISTDLHSGSMNGGMKDMLNVMSKFLNLGMSLPDVIDRSTWQAARVIDREDLGHLGVGAPADVAVLGIRHGAFGFLDVVGQTLSGDRKLEAELTIRGGRVVWDLNGRAGTPWQGAGEP